MQGRLRAGGSYTTVSCVPVKRYTLQACQLWTLSLPGKAESYRELAAKPQGAEKAGRQQQAFSLLRSPFSLPFSLQESS